MDPKQLKMVVLMGILSVVLVAVLFFAFSGSPAPKTAAANGTQPASAPTASGQQTAWTQPEPWPEEIRDPMSKEKAALQTQSGGGPFHVKGIVFSQTRPSAIIGDQIVFIGDTINGATIIAIQKETVEFKKDDKQWTQQVQR